MARLIRLALAVPLSAAVIVLPGGVHGVDADVYVVSPGDSLSAIADRLDVGVGALARVNGLPDVDFIMAGQRLTIPGTGQGGATQARGRGTYTVNAGDALSVIADRHGVALNALLGANGLTINSVIHPGQHLTIPAGGTRSPGGGTSGASVRTYTVEAGDSLSAIAARHAVTLAALLAANNLTIVDLIHPGQRLTLPAGAAAPAPEPDTSSAAIRAVLNYATAQVGKPYKFFTHGPATFDCSGLTLAAYAQIGVTLVHHSATQARQGRAVDFWSEPIQAGDLVFLATDGGNRINHVGIALSSSAWIQARSTRDVVELSPMPPKGVIMAVRRFVTDG